MRININLDIPVAQKAREFRFLLASFIFCALCQVADIVSSLGARPNSGFYEMNPFARHADGSFWLSHGILMKVFFLLFYGAVAASIYLVTEKIHRRTAKLAAAIPLIYFAYMALSAAASNFLLFSGLGRF